MTLNELQTFAEEIFSVAVANAIQRPEEENAELEELKRLCWSHHKDLGFDCMADCFEAVIPKSDGKLDLNNWSSAEIESHHWRFKVRCRSFRLSSTSAHLEIHHEGALPGVTETGYRSIFTPMTRFADMTPENFIKNEVCKDLPKSSQMTLF